MYALCHAEKAYTGCIPAKHQAFGTGDYVFLAALATGTTLGGKNAKKSAFLVGGGYLLAREVYSNIKHEAEMKKFKALDAVSLDTVG